MNAQIVVYVIGSLGKGGAESQLLLLMNGLAKSEFKPILFVLDSAGPLKLEVEQAGITIVDGGYRSPQYRLMAITQLARATWRLVRLLVQSRAKVVHGFLPLANLCAALAGRLAFTPLIITSRRALNTHQDRFANWIYLDKMSGWLSDIIVANSEAVGADTRRREGMYSGKLCVVHNGIDMSIFVKAALRRSESRINLGLFAQDIVLITVANLIPYKGYVDLIESFGQLCFVHQNIKLLVVGEDRGILTSLQEQANALGVADKILWLGRRNDIAELLGIADIYVCASHEEGFSNALLEALASGKIVVATKVGGNVEMLEDGKLGILVEPHDVVGLVFALNGILNALDQYAPMGVRASEWVADHYDLERMIDSYIKLYRDCRICRH